MKKGRKRVLWDEERREEKRIRIRMAGRLSQVFRAVNQSLNAGGKHQVANVQKRHIGNLPVKPNPYVEDWATHRENVEMTFKFDGKTIAILGVAAVTVPYAIYQMCCSEFVSIS